MSSYYCIGVWGISLACCTWWSGKHARLFGGCARICPAWRLGRFDWREEEQAETLRESEICLEDIDISLYLRKPISENKDVGWSEWGFDEICTQFTTSGCWMNKVQRLSLSLSVYISGQHTFAYVSIRQHTPLSISLYHSTSQVSMRQHKSAYLSLSLSLSISISLYQSISPEAMSKKRWGFSEWHWVGILMSDEIYKQIRLLHE